MSGHIVVGTDGSAPARQAVRTAGELAAALGAHLSVVCGYEKLEIATLSQGSEDFRYASDEEALAIAEREAAGVRHLGITATSRTVLGKPADAVVKIAEELNATLIVVGNKRVQGMSRLLGSIASSVAAKAPCDVYIAHTN